MYSPHFHLCSSWTVIPENQSPPVGELLHTLTKGMQKACCFQATAHIFRHHGHALCNLQSQESWWRWIIFWYNFFQCISFFPASSLCSHVTVVDTGGSAASITGKSLIEELWIHWPPKGTGGSSKWLLTPIEQAPFNKTLTCTEKKHLSYTCSELKAYRRKIFFVVSEVPSEFVFTVLKCCIKMLTCWVLHLNAVLWSRQLRSSEAIFCRSTWSSSCTVSKDRLIDTLKTYYAGFAFC